MTSPDGRTFLRRALLLDGIISGATGVLLLAGATVLQDFVGLPASLLRYAGAVLLPFAAFVGHLAMRTELSRSVVWGVVAINAAWVVASLGLVVEAWAGLTALGVGFVLFQAAAVAVFAELQVTGLGRA